MVHSVLTVLYRLPVLTEEHANGVVTPDGDRFNYAVEYMLAARQRAAPNDHGEYSDYAAEYMRTARRRAAPGDEFDYPEPIIHSARSKMPPREPPTMRRAETFAAPTPRLHTRHASTQS
jgi:hypothetical protein